MEDDVFLLQIYRSARTCSAAAFQPAVVAMLRSRFRFASMMWGNGLLLPASSEVVPTALHKELLDDEFLRRWAQQVVGRDPAIPLLARQPGRAHAIEVAQFYQGFPELVAFGRQYGIEYFTVIAGPGLEPEHTSWLCLYRPSSMKDPTEADLRWLEAIMPHLAEAWRINVAIHTAAQQSNPRSFALAEAATARLLVTDDKFKRLLAAEWMGFDGGFVPSPLARYWLDRDAVRFEGKFARFEAKKVTDLVYLSANPVERHAVLSPRLRQVAVMYAKGLSHKEIAQRIGISPATVRNEIAAAYAQLQIHSKLELLVRIGTELDQSRGPD